MSGVTVPALWAEGVTKSYGGRTIIQDISLSLEKGELTEAARESLTVTLDHSIRLMAAAFELWDFGVWSSIIRATVYEGLFLVGRAVLEGTFQSRDAVFRLAGRNKEQL